jgi:hypothetical protein
MNPLWNRPSEGLERFVPPMRHEATQKQALTRDNDCVPAERNPLYRVAKNYATKPTITTKGYRP